MGSSGGVEALDRLARDFGDQVEVLVDVEHGELRELASDAGPGLDAVRSSGKADHGSAGFRAVALERRVI